MRASERHASLPLMVSPPKSERDRQKVKGTRPFHYRNKSRDSDLKRWFSVDRELPSTVVTNAMSTIVIDGRACSPSHSLPIVKLYSVLTPQHGPGFRHIRRGDLAPTRLSFGKSKTCYRFNFNDHLINESCRKSPLVRRPCGGRCPAEKGAHKMVQNVWAENSHNARWVRVELRAVEIRLGFPAGAGARALQPA
ncbi:hypothetical protein EVAR_21122_1 [Eumeta japonica]|uniref:Uncharacterized protein n=1 Tax=Eumeta variegata TaxID=151549 RepID=A0A4C1VSN2_EUMVA|nr:hypothetical protein EVAR_21122_1 [Eumeta japonica]